MILVLQQVNAIIVFNYNRLIITRIIYIKSIYLWTNIISLNQLSLQAPKILHPRHWLTNVYPQSKKYNIDITNINSIIPQAIQTQLHTNQSVIFFYMYSLTFQHPFFLIIDPMSVEICPYGHVLCVTTGLINLWKPI